MPIEVFVYLGLSDRPATDPIIINPGKSRTITRVDISGNEELVNIVCNEDDLGFTTQVIHPLVVFGEKGPRPFAVYEDIDAEELEYFGEGSEEIIESFQIVGKGKGKQRTINGKFHLKHFRQP